MRTVGALDVRDQCTGFVYGLSVAEAYVKGGFTTTFWWSRRGAQHGLDFSTKGRDVAVIFGTGGRGRRRPRNREGSSPPPSFEGKYAKELWVEGPVFSTIPGSPRDDRRRKHFPKMNGRYVFTHASALPEVTREASNRTASPWRTSPSHSPPGEPAHHPGGRGRPPAAEDRVSPTSSDTETPRRRRSHRARRVPRAGRSGGDIVCSLVRFRFTWPRRSSAVARDVRVREMRPSDLDV